MSEKRARRPAMHPCTWPGCSASLTCPHHLQQHIREKHTHEKPFICGTCADVGKETRFARNASLLRHSRTVHRLEVDRTGGQVNVTSTPHPETGSVESNLHNLLGGSPTTYSSPADILSPARSETPGIISTSSTPAPAATHPTHWNPPLDSAMPTLETAVLDPAFEPMFDYFNNDNDMQGPTICACCQKLVPDIRTHFNSCLNGNAPPELPTAFDEELADLHAFSSYLDIYEALFTNQQPSSDHSPLTGTEATADPADAFMSDSAMVDQDDQWFSQVMELD